MGGGGGKSVVYCIRGNFLLEIFFAKPSYVCIVETFGGINFTNAVKVAISSMQSFKQRAKKIA
jgi:hypothetical protein